MKVSIITPAYNSERYILNTYESIKNQTYTDWEWLVTDDCSTDNTLSLLKELAKEDCRVRVFRNPENSGAALSRNNSINHAIGDFLAFIDSDDLWLSSKLEKQLAFMGNNIAFSFTAYELIDAAESRLNKSVDSTQKGSFSYQDMLRKKATLGCSTVMLRRQRFNDISMPLIRTGQDYALWLKLLKTGENAHILNDVLTQYRILPDSISRNKIKKSRRQWQIYRDIENLGFIESIINFCFYAHRAVFRKT
ncbi:glycosyltransferase family 2 protein [Pseudoalteromonas aurantia]|uniref:Glycosyl transferase family 2 n=1 Tax=Pseudoalteromonas aurantia TaxID=43654 RepID=A0A5S3VDW3_9GAMM|nr:glycosyltransferase family 2 protein [Pseudoalteromonas aurantia]TMO69955.1 glycosyl transferase family 2 [Pseudoalteromonas aurantia]TMO75984.1 glycosyl transferase family 2 [Pseudoalteromonas aurantia]